MKILIFSHEFPPMVGGAGTYSLELAVGARAKGHSVQVVSGHSRDREKDDQTDSYLVGLGISIERYHWRNISRMWFLFWKRIFLKIISKSQNIDLIIVTNYTANIIGSKAFKKLQCRYRIVVHGSDVNYFFNQPRIKDRFMFKKNHVVEYFSNADTVISPSKYMEDRLLSYLPNLNNTKVINHGVDLDWIDNEAVKLAKLHQMKLVKTNSLGACINNVKIFSAGRLVAGKGHDKLIGIVKQIHMKHKSITLKIAGDGPLKKSLNNRITSQNIQHIVSLLGPLDKEHMARQYYECDVFILLSRLGESFGLVFIEAMAMGKVVIGPKGSGVEEIIDDGENGFLVDPENSSEVSKVLMKLLGSVELRKRMGLAARVKVVNEFSLKDMVERTIG